MTSTHRWLADEAKDTRRLVPFPCLRQNPAGVRHERIPKLEEDVGPPTISQEGDVWATHSSGALESGRCPARSREASRAAANASTA